MSRILLEYILPLLLPSGVFVVYTMLTKRAGSDVLEERLRHGPWFWLIIAGFALATGILVFGGLHDSSRGGDYVPPHMENGQVVPGGFE